MLEDEVSKATFCDVLRYRITGNAEFLKQNLVLPEYKIYMRQHYDVLDEETVCYAKV